jgi:multiple antibiotic resistance protein
MEEFLKAALVTFTSILFIVDPLAAVPAYLVITQDESAEQRRRTARRACVGMAVILVVFTAAGGAIFRVFGITLPAFRIAGGLILWLVAFDMLRAQRSTQEGSQELVEGRAKEEVALTPLAIPILAGPGAISTSMVLASQAKTWAEVAAVYGSILITAVASYVTLRLGARVLALLGQTGIRVLTRIMGLVLAALATQFILTGIGERFAL